MFKIRSFAGESQLGLVVPHQSVSRSMAFDRIAMGEDFSLPKVQSIGDHVSDLHGPAEYLLRLGEPVAGPVNIFRFQMIFGIHDGVANGTQGSEDLLLYGLFHNFLGLFFSDNFDNLHSARAYEWLDFHLRTDKQIPGSMSIRSAELRRTS